MTGGWLAAAVFLLAVIRRHSVIQSHFTRRGLVYDVRWVTVLSHEFACESRDSNTAPARASQFVDIVMSQSRYCDVTETVAI